MGRPREFDEAEVLAAAIDCFWERGYEATSIRELADKMGLTGASLYNAFGDKRTLYRRALNHYIETTFADRVRRLEGKLSPPRAISTFFAEIIQRSLDDERRRGCMLVNSALEVAPHDPEFREIVTDVLGHIEAFFRRCVQAGQRDGTITTSQSATDLGRLLLGVHIGLRVLARTRPERPLLEGMVRPALALLDPRADDKQNAGQ
ncbi:TetR/AcrR family transcriptional regulator [Achromobacter sp. UMC46]|uniref:TetR/AcrR family transcriptional regulator n=1 Tax=Achromobacter sp. UMC46 TaxID=1862319 RepID=UPI001600801F|nr:TetR/AcrR family transcriptional regulator [Achromobacter sp. UMC46]MBB1593412.1 TetR family transcriptional regulator [Achromobacter sp. UMC46]